MRNIFILIFLFTQFTHIWADEGFWYPLLNGHLYMNMKQLGCKLLPGDICNNGKSISNAVVQFNGGCTGSIISNEGLLITNYHCCKSEILACVPGYKNLDSFTGFWAENRNSEIPIPNLRVKQLIEVKYVSKDSIEYYKDINSSYECDVSLTYTDDKYIMYIYQIFTDIRMVAVPPSCLGRLGGELANWEWPRYSADFAMFRIYSNKQNQPSEYSENNVPYTSGAFIPVSTSGYSEGDFSLILGYPGGGSPCETADFINLMTQKSYPLRAKFYLAKIENIRKSIELNPLVEKRHESLLKGLLNREKRWTLMLDEMNRCYGVEERKKWELGLFDLAQSDSMRTALKELQDRLSEKYEQMEAYSDAYDFYREGFKFISMFTICNQVNDLYKDEGDFETIWNSPTSDKKIKLFYENFNSKIDSELFIQIMNLYKMQINPRKQMPCFIEHKQDIEQWGEYLYTHSVFSSYDKLKDADIQDVVQDPLTVFMKGLNGFYNENVWPYLLSVSDEINTLKRDYRKLVSKMSSTDVWPEVDGNLRLSYGKVVGEDGNHIFQTTLGNLGEASNSDFVLQIPDEMDGANNDKLPLCFLTDTQTSSGSSGSPVLNGDGKLIGVNFDRNHGGTVSDLYYNKLSFRNISVDIRYILFVLQVYGKSNWLLEEMGIKFSSGE